MDPSKLPIDLSRAPAAPPAGADLRDPLHLAQAGADAGARRELLLDVTQIGLALAGIADPTPTADGLDAAISIARGDWLGAGLSAVSMLPYLGDLAKLGRVADMADTLGDAARLAARDPVFAEQVGPALQVIDNALERVPAERLPAGVSGELGELRGQLNAALDASATQRASRVSAEAAGETLASADEWIRTFRERVVAQPGRDPAQVRRELLDEIDDPATRSFVESATREIGETTGTAAARAAAGGAAARSGLLPEAGPLAGARSADAVATRIDELEDAAELQLVNVSGDSNLVYMSTEANPTEVIRVSREAVPAMGPSIAREAEAAIEAGRIGFGPRVNVASSAVLPEEGYAALVLERFGRSLSTVLEGDRMLPSGEQTRIVENLGNRLGLAHRTGWSHGEIHAGNVLVNAQGDVRLTDFASSRRLQADDLTRTNPDSALQRDIEDYIWQARTLRPADASWVEWRQTVESAYMAGLRPATAAEPGQTTGAAMPGLVERAEAIFREAGELYLDDFE